MNPVTNVMTLVVVSLLIGLAYRFAVPKIDTRPRAATVTALIVFFGL